MSVTEEVARNTEIVDGRKRRYVLRMDVIIPTYKSGKKFSRLLEMLPTQTYPIGEITVTNTEEAYRSGKGFEGIGNLEVYHLSKEELDHRVARNRGAHCSRVDIMVLMTDGAILADERLIEYLTTAFNKREPSGELVITAYARQLPDKGCAMAERLTRSSNYPEDSYMRTKGDLGRIGIKIFFASNVCCVYDRGKLWLQGGLIQKTMFNGDMILAGEAVFQGDYTIAYVVEARVIHSHNYGCAVQLHRNSDLVVSQTDHPEVPAGIHSEGEGIRLVRQTARYPVTHRRP